MKARTWIFGALAGAWAVSAGCANTSDVAGRVEREAGPGPSFSDTDASVSVPEAGLTSYCASDKCTVPYTTCPGSRFLCDVNLSNDPENCGACGVKCPGTGILGGEFQCIGGKCELRCSLSPSQTADCDGIPDNGCEINLGNSDNCNFCGDKCLDPDKPCIANVQTKTAKCGCEAGFTYCKNSFPEKCLDLRGSDESCGACGRACSGGGDGGAPPPNSHYGCVDSECGHLKCNSGFTDCDGDLLAASSNGCETSLVSDESCGGCGVACDPSQFCAIEYLTKQPKCFCGAGEKNCGTTTSPSCHDISSDPFNCGGCGVWCALYYLSGGFVLSHFVPTCTAGSCGYGCENGWADCNGRIDDGCEVNTNSDPDNCGGCGIVCDALAGQACVAGQCALEPCDKDGGLAR